MLCFDECITVMEIISKCLCLDLLKDYYLNGMLNDFTFVYSLSNC